MTRGEIGDTLALVNAVLNGTSALCLLYGRFAIAKKKIETHRASMLAALFVSATFLASYLTRVALTGTHKDPHTGAFHLAYLAVLGTHMILAIAVVPLVLTAVWLALKKRFASHKKVARVTFPIWLYVSVTGVLVYVMLYVVPA
jgi:putative membrane protein